MSIRHYTAKYLKNRKNELEALKLEVMNNISEIQIAWSGQMQYYVSRSLSLTR